MDNARTTMINPFIKREEFIKTMQARKKIHASHNPKTKSIFIFPCPFNSLATVGGFDVAVKLWAVAFHAHPVTGRVGHIVDEGFAFALVEPAPRLEPLGSCGTPTPSTITCKDTDALDNLDDLITMKEN